MRKIKQFVGNFLFVVITGIIVTVIGGLILWDLTSNNEEISKSTYNGFKDFFISKSIIVKYIVILILLMVLIYILIKKTRSHNYAENELSITMLNYKKSDMEGIVEFDYSDNDGLYTIGSGDFEFTTKWTKASDTNIHAYKDPYNIKKISLVKEKDIKNLQQNLNDISNLNFSSRTRTPNIGDMIVWINIHDNVAFTKILDIKDDTRNYDNDYLKFEYYIYNKNS